MLAPEKKWGYLDRMIDLREWLSQHGLESCAEILVENAVGLNVLSELQEADFEKIRLALGPRKRLLKAIRELDRSRLGDSGESPKQRPDSFSDSDASILECDLHSDIKRHRAAAASWAKAAPRTLPPFLMVVSICAAAALGWVHYRNLQQYAQAEKSYSKLMNLAQASAVKLRFDEAENFYARAYELSEQLDRSHKQDLLNAKAANYTKLLVTPYRDVVYSV